MANKLTLIPLSQALKALPDGPSSLDDGFDQAFIQEVLGAAYRHGVNAEEVFARLKDRQQQGHAVQACPNKAFASYADAA